MTTGDSHPVLLISDNVWAREGDALREIAPRLEPVIYVGDEPVSDDVVSSIDIAFYSSDLWPERSRGIALSILRATQLKWLHTFSAGVDSPFFQQLLERGVRLSNSTGATASPIAQTAILYMLALSRNVRAWMKHQDAREWERHQFTELDGARLAVIGMGPIGMEIARLGVACATYGFDQLDAVLSRADWVAVALPLTNDTVNLFDAARLSRMKPGAHFINVGRGELVEEPALVAALQSGHIAGAGLDVFAVEPLPQDSPLWSMPNVIVTPHSSGASPKSAIRAEKLFVENFRNFLAGAPLRNEVR
jgi:D-2-hydroxyacid dehydrogenase (NADP+)